MNKELPISRLHRLRNVFFGFDTIHVPEDVDVVICNTLWHIVIDPFTGFQTSAFYSRKNEYLEPFCQTLLEWEQHVLGIKYLQHDDAGENKAFIKKANSPK